MKKQPAKTAAELVAELKQDAAYQAKLQKDEELRQARISVNREIASPVILELVRAGFSVSSIANLHSDRHHYPAAIPILLAWLPRVSNTDVKQDIVRCLSVPYAKPIAAQPLINEFRRAEGDDPTGLRWTIGNALDVVADDTVIDDMIALATEPRYGRAREMVVLGLGNMCDPRAIPVLIELLKDDEVSGHAIKALGKLKPAGARRHVEPFLTHPKAWVRKEAKKTLESIDKVHGGIH